MVVVVVVETGWNTIGRPGLLASLDPGLEDWILGNVLWGEEDLRRGRPGFVSSLELGLDTVMRVNKDSEEEETGFLARRPSCTVDGLLGTDLEGKANLEKDDLEAVSVSSTSNDGIRSGE